MNFFKKLSSDSKFVMTALAIVVVIGILWPRPTGFSTGFSAHLGNLKGSVNLEFFEGADDKPTLVYFGKSTCPHCQKFNPIWDDLVSAMSGDDGVKLLKVETTQETELAKDAGISTVPSVRFYPKGLKDMDSGVEHKGDRTVDALKSFVGSHS